MNANIDIVLPCYNPGNSWFKELESFYTFFNEHYPLRFILVNDGSFKNGIEEQVASLVKKGILVDLISYPKNMGKGYALRQGVLRATADFIVYTDVDFPFTNESMAHLIDTLVTSSCDVVAGYRDENYYQKKMSPYRRLLSKAFRYFIRNILKMSVTDTQCGLKGFNGNGRKKFLETTINRYLFDFEFIYASERDPAIVLKTVQVRLKEGVIFSKMRLKILSQELLNLAYVLAFKK